ncbi:MAG: cyanophycinase [Planctomycetaceae bacterium]
MWAVCLAVGINARAGWGEDPIDPAGVRGALVLCGGGRLPESVREEFLKRAGDGQAKLVVIPTGSDDDTLESDARAVAEIWKSRGAAEVSILHTRLPEEANDDAFVAPLKSATGVWITGGKQTLIARSYSGTLVERELAALIDRGGVVGGTSAGAACLSRVMIVRGEIFRDPGLGLVPGAVVDQHFLVRDRRARLLRALEKHPALVGLGVDEATALIISGRSLRCVGDSTVTVCFGANGHCDCEEVTLNPGDESDLTMLRRRALARLDSALSPAGPREINVPAGALVIAGGGQLPNEIARRFIDLAGGPEAPIVVLPTGNPDPLPAQPADGRFLEQAGARNVRVLAARRRDEVESKAFLAAVREARGVWFGGGRQWRFVDAYEATPAVDAFRDVLRRGGVIGGSSAGATIQGEYLVRGSPLGNRQMMCPGYERGFGFLPGAAIDQHAAERQRLGDMSEVVAAHPQLLGISLDESTAIVVQGSTAEVLGKGAAHFYDRSQPVAAGQPEYESLAAGAKYDLARRTPVEAD